MKSEVQCVWQQWSPAEKMSTEAGQRGTTRTAPSYPSPSITARAAASLLLLLHPCLPGGRSCRPGLFITVRRQDRFFTPTTTPGQGPAPPRRSSVLRATKQPSASVVQFHSLIEASLLVLAPRGCVCAVRGRAFALLRPCLLSPPIASWPAAPRSLSSSHHQHYCCPLRIRTYAPLTSSRA